VPDLVRPVHIVTTFGQADSFAVRLDGMWTGFGWRRLAIVLAVVVAVLLPAAATSAVSASAVAAPTGFVLPVPPPPLVLTAFAPPPNKYGAGHRGVDLAVPQGAPIVAAGAGVVVFAGPLAGRGVVSIEHTGGLRTTYEPVTATDLQPGMPIARGQPLGTLDPGHPGCPTAACLHWGLRQGDRYLDPLLLIGRGQVRLLPLNRAPGQ
jgi:murein DD-endopeptidase MepM/ murein hydrolase activator NlpD